MVPLEQAMALHQAGNLTEAAALFKSILQEQPQHPEALHMMGVIAFQLGKTELALKFVEASLSVAPTLTIAWLNRVLFLRRLNRLEEAFEVIQQTIKLNPNLAEAWDSAGNILREMKRYPEAKEHHQQAVKLAPQNRNFCINYAKLLVATEDILDAYEIIVRAPASDNPLVDDLPYAQGNVLQAAGYPEKANMYFEQTIRNHPQLSVGAQINAGFNDLKMGNLEKGWLSLQIRPDKLETILQHIPKWNGEKIKHILLYEDQGFGDAIFAARYIPKVREIVEQITIYFLTDSLASLFKFNFPYISVVIKDEPLPNVDARCLIMNLPYHFRTTLKTIPSSRSYFKSIPKILDPWNEILLSTSKPRIGIVWSGNPILSRDHTRSLHPDQLPPLLNAGKGHLVSIQKDRKAPADYYIKNSLVDAEPWIKDFSDTALLLDHLDLVITVDTSTAHLAASMGKPVWLLVSFDPDWRWMLDREDSPWYPTIRIYRQTAPKDWSSVIQRVSHDLKQFINGNVTVLKPEIWSHPPATQNKHALPLPPALKMP